MIYVAGSLRNPNVPKVANELRSAGFEVFDEWFAAGEIADDRWRDYEKGRGWTYARALRESYAAHHIFNFDRYHLIRCNAIVLVLPAGKSGFLELGYVIGKGKPGAILLDEPERWDVMFQFADVLETIDDVVAWGERL